jgi:hypothetical protein
MDMVPADDAWLRATPIDPDRFAAFYRAHARELLGFFTEVKSSASLSQLDLVVARTKAGWVVFDRRH